MFKFKQKKQYIDIEGYGKFLMREALVGDLSEIAESKSTEAAEWICIQNLTTLKGKYVLKDVVLNEVPQSVADALLKVYFELHGIDADKHYRDQMEAIEKLQAEAEEAQDDANETDES